MKTVFKTNKIMIVLLIAVLFSVSSIAYTTPSDTVIKIIIDQEVQDYESLIINGRTMVPMRAIFERLGAEVNWCSESRTVEGLTGEVTVFLRIDDKLAKVGSKSYILDAPATIVKGRTMVPLRFISESLGAEVSWNAQLRSAFITTKPTSEITTVVNPPKVQTTKDLRGLQTGMSIQQAEGIMGQATDVYEGPCQSQWRSYHDNYKNYFLIGYKNNQVYFIYTNSPGENFGGATVGDSMYNLPSQVVYRKGTLTATFSAQNDKRLQLTNGMVAIYYLDQHDQNRISGIRVVSPESIISDVGVLSYRLSYSDANDVPKQTSFASLSKKSVIENSQSRIHLELDNAVRTRMNLHAFTWNTQVSQVAYLHSKDMADNNYFSHTSLSGKCPFTRLGDNGITYRYAAENLSWGEGYYDAIESHHGLMNSLGHRKNLISSDLREVGIGANYNGGLYFTQKFITR